MKSSFVSVEMVSWANTEETLVWMEANDWPWWSRQFYFLSLRRDLVIKWQLKIFYFLFLAVWFIGHWGREGYVFQSVEVCVCVGVRYLCVQNIRYLILELTSSFSTFFFKELQQQNLLKPFSYLYSYTLPSLFPSSFSSFLIFTCSYRKPLDPSPSVLLPIP